MKVYILSMERNGDREGHHYNSNVKTCLADICIEGLLHEDCRGGKYEMRIELAEVNGKGNIENIPREVAINYAILKYPEKFDDQKRLKELA